MDFAQKKAFNIDMVLADSILTLGTILISACVWFQPDEKPDVSYSDIGGMDMQKQEMKEAVELPLTHFELYKQIGIDPPRGVLMYGPPGKNLS